MIHILQIYIDGICAKDCDFVGYFGGGVSTGWHPKCCWVYVDTTTWSVSTCDTGEYGWLAKPDDDNCWNIACDLLQKPSYCSYIRYNWSGLVNNC